MTSLWGAPFSSAVTSILIKVWSLWQKFPRAGFLVAEFHQDVSDLFLRRWGDVGDEVLRVKRKRSRCPTPPKPV